MKYISYRDMSFFDYSFHNLYQREAKEVEKKKKYTVNKALNNNVILAFDEEKREEVVLVGKGIGFGKKEGTTVKLSEWQIEKSFLAFDGDIKKEYYQLINQLNGKVIGLSEEIIAMAEKELGQLNSHVHIALTDHISFAIERIKAGMDINNPFIYEIKALYPDEFTIGKRAAKMIKDRLGVIISEDEMGFIALHIHSARQSKKVTETIKDTKLIKDLVNIVEEDLDIDISNIDLSYSRLVNHLRAGISRMEEKKYIENPLLNTIKERFKVSYTIAEKIGEHIEKIKGIYV